MTLPPLVVIARLTVHETARRRILWVLAALTVASVGLTMWGVDRLVANAREGGTSEIEIRIGVSQVLILIAFMFSFVLAMTAAFLGAPAVAGDVESGVAHALLARPVRRADFVVGRWIGLAIVVVAYTVASGLLAIAAVRYVSGHAPPEPLTAVAFLAGEALVLLSLAILLSTRLPAVAAGAICVVAFGLAWMIGVLGPLGRVFGAEVLGQAADVARLVLPTDGLWRGVIFGLEPPLVILLAAGLDAEASVSPFFAIAPPPIEFVAWSIGWVVAVLGLAVRSFARRDL